MLPTGSYCSQSTDSLLQQTVSNTSSHCTLLQCPPEKSKKEEAEEEEVAAEMFEELLKLRCGRYTIWRQRSAWKKRHYSCSSSTMLTIKYLDSRRELSKQISKKNLQANNIRTITKTIITTSCSFFWCSSQS